MLYKNIGEYRATGRQVFVSPIQANIYQLSCYVTYFDQDQSKNVTSSVKSVQSDNTIFVKLVIFKKLYLSNYYIQMIFYFSYGYFRYIVLFDTLVNFQKN